MSTIQTFTGGIDSAQFGLTLAYEPRFNDLPRRGMHRTSVAMRTRVAGA
jgi:predicted metal-dependent phosphotriesterase family hydrolase